MTDTLTPAINPQQLFYEQAKQRAAHSPILHLLCDYFRSRQDMIYHMKDERPDDAALLDFISNAFGIWGGGSLNPEGWYEYKGGKHPHLLIQNRQHETTHKLEGKHLVSAFRTVFGVQGDQLSLF